MLTREKLHKWVERMWSHMPVFEPEYVYADYEFVVVQSTPRIETGVDPP